MRDLSPSIIESVKRKVVADFPELVGVEPICRRKKIKPGIAEKLNVSLPKKVEKLYVLTFRKEIPAEGLQLVRVVRATVTSDGNVVKVTVSK